MKHLWIEGSTKKDKKKEASSPFPLPIGERIKERGRIKIYKHGIWFILMPILLVFLFSQITMSQDEAATPQIKRPYKLPPNLMQYFKGKYINIRGLYSNIQETPNGPLGGLSIRGDIKPKAEIQGETREERARAMAIAFITEEAILFDIVNLEEIRESNFRIIGGGVTFIEYQRYIGGLPLDDAYINVDINPDEKITGVGAGLVPTPPELYHAVTRETLTKEQIIKIIERDLAPPGKKSAVRISKIDKVAISLPPYVIYKVEAGAYAEYSWNYRVDAFTGEILEKQDARRFLR